MSDNGVVRRRSRFPFDETVSRLTALIESKGVKMFSIIDHAAAAAGAGLKMPPTKVLLFGSPKAGTPLMLAAPSVAIDLPLKILVWQERDGSTWMAYNTAEYLAQRHGLPHGQLEPLGAADALTAAFV